jgi:hypothetical protein
VLLVWARAEDAAPVHADMVAIGPATAERLRTEAARLGEWRVEDPAASARGAVIRIAARS